MDAARAPRMIPETRGFGVFVNDPPNRREPEANEVNPFPLFVFPPPSNAIGYHLRWPKTRHCHSCLGNSNVTADLGRRGDNRLGITDSRRSASEAKGRRFESCRAHQFPPQSAVSGALSGVSSWRPVAHFRPTDRSLHLPTEILSPNSGQISQASLDGSHARDRMAMCDQCLQLFRQSKSGCGRRTHPWR